MAEAVEDLLDIKNEKFGTLDFDELFEILDWVSDIAIVPPNRDLVPAGIPTLRSIIRFTDRWMREDRNQLSAYDASEGALYVLFALLLAMHPESPKVFAIDNFDHAMHPRLARATTRIFSQEILKTDRQALLTTHNPLVLDGLNLSDDRIRLFAVERNSYGATKIYRIQVSEEILQASQHGLSLSNLWIMGRLGGVPDIFWKKAMNIGTVVEGPTDREVLNAVINRLIPGEHRYFPLQPRFTGRKWNIYFWCPAAMPFCWVNSNREDYECFKPNKDMPAYRLSLKDYGKLTEQKDGEIKKHLRRYREVVIKIADNWDTVCRICSQAQRFMQNIVYRHL